jgi:hypothetical protein
MLNPTNIKPTRRRKATANANPVPSLGVLKIPAHIRRLAETTYERASEGSFMSFGKDGWFFIRVPQDIKSGSAVLRPDLVYSTNLFRFIAMTHKDSPQTVLAWIIQPKFPHAKTRSGKNFVASVRRHSTPPGLWKSALEAGSIKSTQTECQAALVSVTKAHTLPMPTFTAAMRGIIVLEVNDLSGLVLTDEIPDFSI